MVLGDDNMTILNKTTHVVEWNSQMEENWMGEGWIVVPKELEQTARECGGFCELEFDGEGELIAITPTEKPKPPEPEPSPAERLRADVDYLAALQGVTL